MPPAVKLPPPSRLRLYRQADIEEMARNHASRHGATMVSVLQSAVSQQPSRSQPANLAVRGEHAHRHRSRCHERHFLTAVLPG
jgi:hypothetical protein